MNTMTQTGSTQNSSHPRALVPAPTTRAINSDVASFFVFFIAVIGGAWAVNDGWNTISHGWTGFWRGAASFSGILTSVSAMVGLLLATRLPWMERSIGLDRLLIWHRVAGDTMGLVLGVHIVTSVVAEMPLRGGLVDTVLDLTGREPYMALTFIGALIIGVVVVSSLKEVRNKLSYETWYFLHLTAYGGVIISYSHQITLGSMLSNDKMLRWMWGILSAYVLLLVVLGRWAALVSAARHPLTVTDITHETDSTVEVTLGGKNLERYQGEGGQFVVLRMMKRGLWWKANPYSLSAAPTLDGMRITIKDRGDASAATFGLRKGDKVAVEGPYGIATPAIFDGHRPLLIAGGVGVTPVRAMLETLPMNSRPLVLLRARDTEDIPHFKEICALTEERRGDVRLVLGRTAQLKGRDPFSPKVLHSLVPNLHSCVAFVCGPTSLTFAARKGLQDAGMSKSQVHLELPWW